jgi:hypothetical protein
MNNNVSILADTSISTNFFVGEKATLTNLSVNNETTLNKVTIHGNTLMNGSLDIKNTASIKDLDVRTTTRLKGDLFDVNTTDIKMFGDILVAAGSTFKINGNITVDTLTYKALLSTNTSAQLFIGGNAITQMEVSDFTDIEGNGINNMSGFATFKSNVNFRNSPAYQTTIQYGTLASPIKIITYSDYNTETFLNGKLNVNTSSYGIGGFDYTGPFTIRGPEHTIYSTNTNISSTATNIKGDVNIYNRLRILAGGSLMIDSEGVTLIDLQKEVQISRQLNISNDGTGPAIRASQRAPQFAEIMLLESDGLDVYSVGDMGNTQIRGKIRLGYNVVSSENTRVNNAPGDIQQISTPFLNYQLDVSGSCIISKNVTVLQDIETQGKLDVLGNVSVHGTTYMNGLLTLKNDLTSFSDRRIKKNIKQLELSLDKIKDIHGYKFQRRDREDEQQFIGMIAQEIEGPFPELVNEFEEKGTTIKTVNYPAFTSVLLECIHELKERIHILENKILR